MSDPFGSDSVANYINAWGTGFFEVFPLRFWSKQTSDWLQFLPGWGPALTDTSDLPKYIQRARCAGKVLLDQWSLDR